MEEFVEEDCRTLLEQANLQEEELRNKRRWLMGLPTSKNEAGQLTESKFQPERPIPESLLREDDVFYETVRSFVKKLVEKHDSKNKFHLLHGDMQLTHSPTDITTLLSLINDMTNQSLFQFAKLLTGSSVKIQRTRWKMKQIIKIHLKKNNTCCIKLSKDHLSVLRNPKSFRWNPDSRFIPDSGSSHSAVQNILNILEDLPTQTLSTMNRKLRGIKDYIPKLTPSKSGLNRAWLIKGVRKKCSKFLSKLKKGDPLQEPLAKAMEVAGLTLKLTERHPYTPNFIQFPRKTIILQNEIATCINLLDENVNIKLQVLKKIQKLLDPNAKTSGRNLCPSIKNVLIQYLFECGEIKTIPGSLTKVVGIIKKSCKANDKIDEEVECVLNLSASMKQVLLDVIPENQFDLEFADVYMEDLEESEGDDSCEDNEENTVSNLSDFNEEVGSTGDLIPVDDSDSVRKPESYSLKGLKDPNSVWYHTVSFGNGEGVESDKDLSEGGICGNGYLDVQGACDEASMEAYRVIGRMLADFAQKEGCELTSHDLRYLGVGSDDFNQNDDGTGKQI